MKFKGSVMRNVVMAGLAVGLLASCGGATQVEAFEPKRIIAFGDENSVIDDTATPNNGRKYTINGIKYQADGTTPVVPTTLNCAANPIWIQILGGTYNMQFNECRDPATTGVQPSRILAVSGAKVSDLAAQIKKFTDSDTFSTNDLSTLLIGTNDIRAVYDSSLADPSLSSDALKAAAGAAGTAAGAEVIKLANLGTKVIVSTLPNLGSSAFAYSEELARPGQGRGQLLSDLTAEFNTRLRLKLEEVPNGGRSVGLVLADDLVRTLVLFPSTYSLSNVTTAACTVDLFQCTVLTLPTGVGPSAYLWADGLHLGPNGHSRIGDQAVTRARNNPF
jgi:phospholipase/lecithinase/hemolysin